MNLFDVTENAWSEEITEILVQNKHVRIERILSCGQTSGWYDQEESEFVVLLQGQAEITYEDQSIVRLTPGDCLFIPPHQKHKVSYTSQNPPCIWLCIFY